MAKKGKEIDLKKMRKRVSDTLKQTGKYFKNIGREAKVFVRRGENEITKVSRIGKAQFEILALNVKKEQLYRQIGMKVWSLSTKGRLTTDRLKTFCEELAAINKTVKNKKMAINRTLRRGI